MACAVKPPDDVCDGCDFNLYDAQTADDDVHDDADDGGSTNGRRRRLTSSDRDSDFDSGSESSSSSSFSGRHGLSKECGACVVSGARESH